MKKILFFILMGLVSLPAFAATEISGGVPYITNTNPDSKAFFYIKRANGHSEIIEVPPNSQKILPEDIIEFQYLYMEGGKQAKSLPDLPSLKLSGSDIYGDSSFVLTEIEGSPKPPPGRKGKHKNENTDSSEESNWGSNWWD